MGDGFRKGSEWGSKLVHFKLCSGTVSVRTLSVANKQELSTYCLRQNTELLTHAREKFRCGSDRLRVWLVPEVHDVIRASAPFLCSSFNTACSSVLTSVC